MTTKELETAIKASKLGNAERDLIDVLARMFEIPENLVERLLFAAHVAGNTGHRHRCFEAHRAIHADSFHGVSLDPALRQGIKDAVCAGMGRAAARWHITTETPTKCPPDRMIADPARICDGCPISLACVARDLSSPRSWMELGPPTGVCSRGGVSFAMLERKNGAYAKVTVLKIVGDVITVSCEHPKGTFEIQAKDLFYDRTECDRTECE